MEDIRTRRAECLLRMLQLKLTGRLTLEVKLGMADYLQRLEGYHLLRFLQDMEQPMEFEELLHQVLIQSGGTITPTKLLQQACPPVPHTSLSGSISLTTAFRVAPTHVLEWKEHGNALLDNIICAFQKNGDKFFCNSYGTPARLPAKFWPDELEELNTEHDVVSCWLKKLIGPMGQQLAVCMANTAPAPATFQFKWEKSARGQKLEDQLIAMQLQQQQQLQQQFASDAPSQQSPVSSSQATTSDTSYVPSTNESAHSSAANAMRATSRVLLFPSQDNPATTQTPGADPLMAVKSSKLPHKPTKQFEEPEPKSNSRSSYLFTDATFHVRVLPQQLQPPPPPQQQEIDQLLVELKAQYLAQALHLGQEQLKDTKQQLQEVLLAMSDPQQLEQLHIPLDIMLVEFKRWGAFKGNNGKLLDLVKAYNDGPAQDDPKLYKEAKAVLDQVFTYLVLVKLEYAIITDVEATYLCNVPAGVRKERITLKVYGPIQGSTCSTEKVQAVTALGAIAWAQLQAVLSMPNIFKYKDDDTEPVLSQAKHDGPAGGGGAGGSHDVMPPSSAGPSTSYGAGAGKHPYGGNSHGGQHLNGSSHGGKLISKSSHCGKQVSSSNQPADVRKRPFAALTSNGDMLHLGSQKLRGSTGIIMDGFLNGQPAFLKFNGPDPAGLLAHLQESDAYSKLLPLQGIAVPKVLASDYINRHGIMVLATQRIDGQSLSALKASGGVDREASLAALRALRCVHQQCPDLCHGDIRLANVMLLDSMDGDGRPLCMWLDFGQAHPPNGGSGQEKEVQKLKRLLPALQAND